MLLLRFPPARKCLVGTFESFLCGFGGFRRNLHRADSEGVTENYNLRCLLEQGRGRSSSSTERVTDRGSAAGTQRQKDRLRDLEIGKCTTTSPTRICSR